MSTTLNKAIIIGFTLFMAFQFLRPTAEPKLPDSFTDEDALNHVCCDSTHELCDGWCDCDGVGCDISKD